MSKYNVKNGKGMLLPDWIVEQMLDEQERQGNKRDVKMFETRYTKTKLNNGFDWEFSEKGNDYWHDILVMGKIPDEPKKQTYPRVMMVSDSGSYFHKRVVEFEREVRGETRYFAWNVAETIEDSLTSNSLTYWKFAKEIEPEQPKVIEVTLEEIAEKFGVEVNNIKIKK